MASFTLSLRDVEELLAERGLDISYETVRRWFLHFGSVYARRLRQGRHKPTDRWFLDEMVIVIQGQKARNLSALLPGYRGETDCGRMVVG